MKIMIISFLLCFLMTGCAYLEKYKGTLAKGAEWILEWVKHEYADTEGPDAAEGQNGKETVPAPAQSRRDLPAE